MKLTNEEVYEILRDGGIFKDNDFYYSTTTPYGEEIHRITLTDIDIAEGYIPNDRHGETVLTAYMLDKWTNMWNAKNAYEDALSDFYRKRDAESRHTI